MSGAVEQRHCEVLVIGSGPAGQKAAVQAAKDGRTVLLVEKEKGVGGACVHRGTIPSKTLRETAVSFSQFKARTNQVIDLQIPEDAQITSLMSHMQRVIGGHETFIAAQMERNQVEQIHGRAAFVDPHHVEVTMVRGAKMAIEAEIIIIATGSHPRSPEDIPVDHEHIFDSDSILSLMYLPKSLTVLGSGVVASEYATIFGSLGVQVTMVDKYPSPLGFLDPELTSRFVKHFEERMGCRFFGRSEIEAVQWNGVDAVETRLGDGTILSSEKLLCALGRVANVDGLQIDRAGLRVNARGVIDTNAHMQTEVPHIYAVGDVIGPPALASTSMEQGRRAMRHALGRPVSGSFDAIPMGIYTIPEMSCVGLTEAQAIERHGGAVVGYARFDELARGQISCCTDGMLKLVCDEDGVQVLGVQIFGEGSTELIHVGQMALLAELPVDVFIENIFNFPTLAEAYRVAALEVVKKRASVCA